MLHHQTLGSREIKKKEKVRIVGFRVEDSVFRVHGFRLNFRVQGLGHTVKVLGVRV